MAQVPRRPVAWGPLIGALVVGAAGASFMAWKFNLQFIDGQINDKQTALKKLAVIGRIPPNQEVMDYLTARQTALENRYQHWIAVVAALPVAEAASADPQLAFQERFHAVQRTLERLATARSMPVPEELGFPKELPPTETVPRLLTQLELIEESAGLILEQRVTALSSFKVEDPDTVTEEEGEGAFLMRLPVRVRLTTSLPGLMKVLRAFERAKSLIDVRSLRIVSGTTPESLDLELLLARYLVVASAPASSPDETEGRPPSKPGSRSRDGS